MNATRPLCNRVDPFGALWAVAARGSLLGNRGGRFHRDDQTLGRRRWASRQWIACVCEFKNRRRDVWGRYYTELFFLDEFTALAAGHRPCFECRRAEAEAFRAAFSSEARISAPEMDVRLHEERQSEGRKRVHSAEIETLPDGAMIARDGAAFLVAGGELRPWSFHGYGEPIARPSRGAVDALTPPSILRALDAGYAPRAPTPPISTYRPTRPPI
jgi:hypothetical protein